MITTQLASKLAESTSTRGFNHSVKLAQILLKNATFILNQWLPEGIINGKEYKAINPRRHDTHIGSFSINIETGVWSDFATSDAGGNLVELYGYLNNIDDPEILANDLEKFCEEHGLSMSNTMPGHVTIQIKSKPPTEAIPTRNMTLLPPDCDVKGNMVTHSWEYRTQQNEVLFYVLRTEPELGKKETKPCRLSQGKWNWSYPDGKLPLYNCHKLKLSDTILFGEGEKVADFLDNWNMGIGMTSAGGCHRLLGSELSPLKQASEVIIFPDADAGGANYAAQIAWYLESLKVEYRILNTTALGWSNGEDVADHPELVFSDYEPHLLDACAWRAEINQQFSDQALFSVIGRLSQPDYDRVAGHLSSVSKISKRTLAAERKRHLAVSFKSSTDEVQVDISDIDLPPEEKLQRRMRLNQSIAELAGSQDILDQVTKVCHETLGVFNEDNLIKLGYLSTVSRLLDGPSDRPVSVIVKGSSSSGKSHVIKQILKLFRENDSYIVLSSISPKGLIYDQRSYRGKVLFMPECNQLSDQDHLATQLVKTILTEGRITHLTVDTSESHSPEGKVIVKEGPIALIVGTIRDHLDSEMETRTISYYVDESHEQTRQILLNTANRLSNPESQDDEAISAQLAVWQKFDEWLALSPVRKVSIPFYTDVVSCITFTPVRFRRDLGEMVPSLIKASALVHQNNREIVDGTIRATLEDYENIRMLVNEFLLRVQGEAVTPMMQRLLKEIYNRMSDEVKASRGTLTIKQAELAKTLGISQQGIAYQLKKLIEKDYLENTQLLAKKPPKLKLGDAFTIEAINNNASVLPSMVDLGNWRPPTQFVC